MKYKRVLLVCTGNTCRSPMAEAIFRDMVEEEPAPWFADIAVKSAGTINLGQSQATDDAVRVMQERGLDINQHRSTHIDVNIVDWADVILVMGHDHKRYVEEHFPSARDKVYLLTEFVGEEGRVPDPFNGGIEVYRECADQLVSLLDAMIEKIKS
ncbi:low molecular weight protein arginine phosphatase [Chloroflexota bacterium]